MRRPSDHDRASFARDGFLLWTPRIPDLDRLAAAVAALPYPTPPAEVRLQDAWRDSQAVRTLATLPDVLAMLRGLLGRRAVPFQTLCFPVGTNQRAHSDTIHFDTAPPDRMCGVWLALEDTDAANGPLTVWPGSHRLPRLRPAALGLRPTYDDHPRYEDAKAAQLAAAGIAVRALHLRRGQAVVWHAHLAHGGAAVTDPARTRLSQATHYVTPPCEVWQPMLSPAGERRRLAAVDVGTGRPVRRWRWRR